MMTVVEKIKTCVRCMMPYGFVALRRRMAFKKQEQNRLKQEQNRLKLIKERLQKESEIKNYFLNLKYSEQTHEVAEIIDYFSKYNFAIFPYSFIRDYHSIDINVFYDDDMCYVLHENKKLYFPRGWHPESVQSYYNGLKIEQDENSPHRYETEEFTVKEGDVIADIGTAEGIWALSNIEKASKVYLFECSQTWITALQKTFEPWKEKVVIVNKYVSNVNDKNNVTLDELFKGERINIIKADIEGYEVKMLEGSKEIFKRGDELKLLLCAYHKENDAVELKEILEREGFSTEFSKGYMLFIWDANLREPYMRRGLMRAKKNVL